jgi:cyclic pyranopterin phosphate synthase
LISERSLALSSQRLVDRKGRVAGKLRISVTDRCNFACLFCMPDKKSMVWLPKEDILSFDEIEHVARVLVSLGITKVRVTGGEPLLRPGVEGLVSRLTKIEGLRSVDLTTNGWFLAAKARALKAAGLRGASVSLHSLQEDRFTQISGINALPRVLEGISEAIRVGLRPLKINSVAIRGYNDDEILDLVEFAREMDVSIRFIEFMPLDGLGIWSPDRMVSGEEILKTIATKFPLRPRGRGKGETASLWGFEDGRGEVGVITPMSQPFCDDCDRIRLTADGKLLSCLFDTEYHDLKPMIRNGGSDLDLAAFIREAVWRKPDGVGYMPLIKEGWAKPRNMNAIGG